MPDRCNEKCPDCGGALRFTLDDVAKHRTVRCSRGHSVELKDQGGGARKANQAMADLDKALKRFGK